MKTILVGTDFSAGSDAALATASRLLASGGSVHLLHVLEPVDDPDSEDPETQSFYRELEAKSQRKLAEQLSSSGLQARTSVRIGARHLTLLEVAEELGAELIVLGSRPMSADSKLLSVSHKVALTSSRPVLLVPHGDS